MAMLPIEPLPSRARNHSKTQHGDKGSIKFQGFHFFISHNDSRSSIKFLNSNKVVNNNGLSIMNMQI